MRKLTASQLDRVYTQVQADGLTHGTIEDLDDLWLDGRFSLAELRRLVEALTLCEQELVESVPPAHSSSPCPLSP